MKSYKYLFIVLFLFNNLTTAQWYRQNSGTTTHLYSVFFIDENTGWACGDSGRIIRTTNGGQDWLEQNSNTTHRLRGIQFVDANNGWAFGYHQILNTTNGGTTWNVQDFPAPVYIDALQYINLNTGWFVYHNSDTSYIAKTTDGGISWTLQAQTHNEYYEAIYFLDENYGWVPLTIIGVLKTTDGGMNWTQNTANLAGSPMCIRFADHQKGWISSNTLGSYDISKSSDGGITWFSQKSASGEYIHSISCPNDSTVYAAGFSYFVPPYPLEEFILKTTDSGNTWIEQYRDNGRLNSIFFINEAIGWAVGDSGKILFTENGGVTSVDDNIISPFNFYLAQNFPNPFNPVTKIEFMISDFGFVSLKVFDILGNEIATLVNEEKQPGTYDVEFNSASIKHLPSSGIYFYQLKAGNYAETKKMLLIK